MGLFTCSLILARFLAKEAKTIKILFWLRFVHSLHHYLTHAYDFFWIGMVHVVDSFIMEEMKAIWTLMRFTSLALQLIVLFDCLGNSVFQFHEPFPAVTAD